MRLHRPRPFLRRPHDVVGRRRSPRLMTVRLNLVPRRWQPRSLRGTAPPRSSHSNLALRRRPRPVSRPAPTRSSHRYRALRRRPRPELATSATRSGRRCPDDHRWSRAWRCRSTTPGGDATHARPAPAATVGFFPGGAPAPRPAMATRGGMRAARPGPHEGKPSFAQRRETLASGEDEREEQRSIDLLHETAQPSWVGAGLA